jgi:hypothetical protein
MKSVVDELLGHLGDPTPPQRLIVQSAAIKAVRLSLLTDRLLANEGLADGADHHALSWLNSMRLDLQALGLERREKPLLDLTSYLTKSRPAAERPAPDAADAGDAEAPPVPAAPAEADAA